MANKNDKNIDNIILQALAEDIGPGDVTGEAIIPQDSIIRAEIIAKSNGVVSGLQVAAEVFGSLDRNLNFNVLAKDGADVMAGTILARIEGNGRAILAGERTALNFLQRMSGIATLTKKFVNAVEGTKAVILDTRKTIPVMRVLDKKAVRDGGGQNHRMGLYDMFLIKDNHIAAAGSITRAVEAVKRNNKQNLLIEVEVEDLDGLREVLLLGVDRVLLDNMSVERMREAVSIAGGKVPLEASGGVSLETITEIANTGVDYISVGGLTHSVKALDISLEIINCQKNE